MPKLAIDGGVPVFPQNTEIVRRNKYSNKEIEAVARVIENGVLSSFRGGCEVKCFEREFASFINSKYALATTSGTTALHTAVASFGFSQNSEVLVPAVTFVSTASVVLQEGLTPVFVDIDENFCMDPKDLERKITKLSCAIIPVHLYGHPAQMQEINNIAKQNGLIVIEDACQSHGAVYHGIKTGALGDIGCFSFYETKNMSCGEGGMITCSNMEIFDRLCLVKEHGSPRTSKTWYSYERLGYNYNMTEVQAAIGRIQLQVLEKNNQARRDNVNIYRNILNGLDLELPNYSSEVVCVSHNLPILLPESLAENRNFIVDALRAEGVPIDIAYPQPLYKTTLFQKLKLYSYCPRAENVTARLFTLFTDNSIDEKIIELTAEAIKKVVSYLK